MGLINRRDFLKVSATGGLVLASNLNPVPAAAREPVPRLAEAMGILYDATRLHRLQGLHDRLQRIQSPAS